MKRLLCSLLALGAVACQSRPATDPAGAVAAPPLQPAPTLVAAAAPAPTADSAGRRADDGPTTLKLTRQRLSVVAATALLAHHNLADFWRGKAFEREEPPMDGFFGTDYRRISFAFTEMRRDSLRPNLYHVTGKTRFRKTVTPFVGALTISTIVRLRPAQGRVEEWGILDADSTSRVYTAKASFIFREEAGAAGAGEFTGTAALDFYLTGNQPAQLAITMGKESSLPAKGAGVLYEGRWTSYQGHLTRPLLLSRNVFATAPAALVNFALGERELSFNPKYAKLGWNEYWANDEWWADSTATAPSL